jgi:hypothetical protein
MKKLSTRDFIKKCVETHGSKYSYEKTEYKGGKKKVCIICPIHGEFWQIAYNHSHGQECPKCADISRIKSKVISKEEFIEKARKVHGNKYDYSKVEYVNYRTKVCIICPKHGEFWQEPGNHIYGYGCKKCANELIAKCQTKTNDEFIEKARKVHGNKYDYSKVEYVNAKAKVCIICPKHGEFWQTPDNHLEGKGCPYCNESKLEKEIRILLTEHNIKFEYNKSKPWLKKQRLDFYLPDYNIGIECQGIQHFEPVDFGSEGYEQSVKNFLNVKKLDLLKKERCFKNGVKLVYYSDKKMEDNIITNKEEILKLL